MLDHIIAVNNKVKEFISANPKDPTLKLILDYKKYRNCKDYYTTLDSLGDDIHFNYIIVDAAKNGDKTEKYLPFLKFRPGNNFGKEYEEISLVDPLSPFVSLSQCYAYVTKEYIFYLMGLSKFREVMEKIIK